MWSIFNRVPLINHCQLCEADTGKLKSCFCPTCIAEFPMAEEACYRCARPLKDGDQLVCGECLKQLPSFDRTVALCYYLPPLDRLIQTIKFNQQLATANQLGEMLAEKLVDYQIQLPECIVPVPLHRQRQQRRGYNQALEIARPIAKRLGLKIRLDLCQRLRATKAQSELPAKQRAKNIRKAFAVNRNKHLPKHICLLDDVLTTGNTLNELAKQFKQAGVEKIDVWVLARAC